MWICTARMPRPSSVAAVVLCGALLAVGVFFAPRSTPASASNVLSLKGVHTNDDRREFLSSCGYTASPEPLSVEELLIPQEPDESEQEYLALQDAQGLDLSACRGKRVKRYTYLVTSSAGGGEPLWAGLLIRRGKVVGADLIPSPPEGPICALLDAG